ncbi:hypothetical protein GQ53DRAFT_889865 [Thozetella sp. PMI_491]|nr:hypothetical protein GQ53DRAFT_889865 [Thozetella sp. PMI_491]
MSLHGTLSRPMVREQPGTEDRPCQYRHLLEPDRGSVISPSPRTTRSCSPPRPPPSRTTPTRTQHEDAVDEGMQAAMPAINLAPRYQDHSQAEPAFNLAGGGAAVDHQTPQDSVAAGWMRVPQSSQPDKVADPASLHPHLAAISSMASPVDATPWLPNLFLSATAQTQPEAVSMLSAEATVIPLLNYPFDWGFTEVDSNIFEPIGAHSQLDASSHRQNGAVPERDAEIVRALKAEEVDGQPNVEDLPNGSPEESSWPNVYRPDAPDGPVALPETRPGSPRNQVMVETSGETATASVNFQARNSMQILAQYAHGSVWTLPDLSTFPSSSSLTTCINLYLANFAPWLPIVDSPRGSFRVDKAAPILLMAIAAVGSVYASHGLERLASPLNELVRREIVYTCEHDQRFVFEPCVVQASLLQSYFGLYSGSPRLFQQSEVSRASLVAACRRMHLLHSVYTASLELARRKPMASAQETSRAVKQDHRNRRLGWAIFLFDAQLACLFGLPALYPMAEILAPLPTPLPDPSNGGIPFGKVMESLLDKGQLPEQPSDMGLSCVAYALYRLCLDAASLPQFFARRPSSYRYNLAFPAESRNPQALLDQLAHHVINTPASLNSLRLSCVALSHHSHLQFSRIGLLDQIKVAAGKSGDQIGRQAAQVDVAERLQDDPAAARHIFSHAAMLRCLLNRFTFDTPTEVVWTFDAALCMWAYIRFSGYVFASRTGPSLQNLPHYALSWKPPPSLDDWVQSGEGDISVQGLGSGSDINVRSVLRSAAERLDVMSWGLAARYREVLRDLLSEGDNRMEVEAAPY